MSIPEIYHFQTIEEASLLSIQLARVLYLLDHRRTEGGKQSSPAIHIYRQSKILSLFHLCLLGVLPSPNYLAHLIKRIQIKRR